jgi:hypothetical protein
MTIAHQCRPTHLLQSDSFDAPLLTAQFDPNQCHKSPIFAYGSELIEDWRPAMSLEVYTITMRTTGRVVYVGVTARGHMQRWSEHQSKVRSDAHGKLYNRLRKYGLSAFSFAVVSIFSDDQKHAALDAERALLQTHNTFLDGCNATRGGDTPDRDLCSGYAFDIWKRPEFRALRKRRAANRRRARLARMHRAATRTSSGGAVA